MNLTNGFGTIGVLMGGYSSEREISLKSGNAVAKALKEAGCQVNALDIVSEDEEKIAAMIREAGIDVAFIVLHGRLGEDGRMQKILEALNIPYVGSDPKASKRALNKAETQSILKKKKLPVSEFAVIKNEKEIRVDQIIKKFRFPIFVKPACEGSSIGISIVHKKEDLEHAIKEALAFGGPVLIEQSILGREMTVGILEEKALPVIEICPKTKFFDFSSKYSPGMTEYIIPAAISQKKAEQIQKVALMAHQSLGCKDLSRVDIMLDDRLNPFILEINTIPGFTSTSLLPKAAKEAGMDFTQLCLKLVKLAYEKKR